MRFSILIKLINLVFPMSFLLMVSLSLAEEDYPQADALKDKHGGVRDKVVKAPVKTDSADAIRELVEDLKLGKISLDDAIHYLGKALKDKNEYVQEASVNALAEIRSDEAVNLLGKALKDGEEWMRDIVLDALCIIGTQKAVYYLGNTLKDKDEWVRDKAIKALGKIGTDEAVRYLGKALEDKKESVRKNAIEALGKIGTDEAVRCLGKALEDKKESVRKNAIETLGRIKTQEASRLLSKTLKDKDAYVQKIIYSFKNPKLYVQSGHSALVTTIALSKDGKYALSGSDTIILWDIDTGREVRTFTGHSGEVTSVALSANGKYALSGSMDNTLILWDISSGRNLKTFKGHSLPVASVALSADGKYALSGSWDDTLKLWSITTGEEVKTFEGHANRVSAVTFSLDGKYALSGSWDDTLKLWNVDTGKEVRTFTGHSGEVTSVALSANGKYVLSGSWDNTLKLWDLNKGEVIRTYKGHTKYVSSVAFSPNNLYVVSESGDDTIMIWELETGKILQTFEARSFMNSSADIPIETGNVHPESDETVIKHDAFIKEDKFQSTGGHSNTVSSVAFSPNGRFILSGSWDHTIKVWDVSTGEEIKTFKGHSDDVLSVTFSPCGRYALSGSRDETLKLWDIPSGREVRTFKGHIGDVSSVAFSPDGKRALSGSWDGNIKLWDLATGKEIRSFRGTLDKICFGIYVVFSPDGKYVLAGGELGSSYGFLKLFDTLSGEELKTFKGNLGSIKSVAFSPDGKYILSGGGDGLSDGFLKLFNTLTGEEIRAFEGLTECVNSAVFSPDGKNVLVGAGFFTGNYINIFKIATGEKVKTFEGHSGSVNSVAISPDGRYAVSGSTDSTLKLWDIMTGQNIKTLGRPSPDMSGIDTSTKSFNSVVFSPDSSYILTGFSDTIRLLDIATGSEKRTMEGYTFPVILATSPDGGYIISNGKDKNLNLWNLATGNVERIFKGHSGTVLSVAFSPDSKYVLSGSSDKTLTSWSIVTGEEVKTFKGHTGCVSSVAFSPDGKLALSGSWDGNIKLWDVETGKEIKTFKGHTMIVSSVAFSPDGKLALSGSYDGNIKLWDVETREEIGSFRGISDENFLGDISVAFSPKDGKYILAGGGIDIDFESRFLKVFETSTTKEIRPFRNLTSSINSFTFSPDGHYVLSGSNDGILKLWDVTKGEECRHPKFERLLNDSILSVAFSPDGKYAIVGTSNGTITIVSTRTGKWLAKLISFKDDSWVVIDPEGRYDSNSPGDMPGLFWVISDDPKNPLPIEIFMEEYYTPQLLKQILDGKVLKPIKAMWRLNRAQPEVKILSIEQDNNHPDTVSVGIEVTNTKKKHYQEGKLIELESDVHDLRLFRDGQLVAQWPEPKETLNPDTNIHSQDELKCWQDNTKITLDSNGKFQKSFTVKLPRRAGRSSVECSAYAFNKDKVKSETARKSFELPKNLKPAKGRAYIISVGVSDSESFKWKLSFAKNTALLFQRTFAEKLLQTKEYEDVISIPIVTYPLIGVDKESVFIWPTKNNIKLVFDLLAGKTPSSDQWKEIPETLRSKIRPVEPMDLILLSISSHGITDKNGEFYFLPYDIGKRHEDQITDELLQRSISSKELSLWLRKLDVEQLITVIDSCYSTKAVEGKEGFKPGPMSASGLGQLSWDKDMPILTATQPDNLAWASSGASLLISSLVEFFEEQTISYKSQATIIDALKYAEVRVPKMYENTAFYNGRAIQRPKLFDFPKKQVRKRPSVILPSKE